MKLKDLVFTGIKKSTYENFVSVWFSSSGMQDVSVAAAGPAAPSNPFVRSHCTQESSQDAVCCFHIMLWPSSLVRFAHCRSSPRLPLWKQAFSVSRVDARSLWEKLDAHKRKKHSVLLCFLVAGPRIELGTSWLWIKNRGICENSRKYKSQIIN